MAAKDTGVANRDARGRYQKVQVSGNAAPVQHFCKANQKGDTSISDVVGPAPPPFLGSVDSYRFASPNLISRILMSLLLLSPDSVQGL